MRMARALVRNPARGLREFPCPCPQLHPFSVYRRWLQAAWPQAAHGLRRPAETAEKRPETRTFPHLSEENTQTHAVGSGMERKKPGQILGFSKLGGWSNRAMPVHTVGLESTQREKYLRLDHHSGCHLKCSCSTHAKLATCVPHLQKSNRRCLGKGQGG